MCSCFGSSVALQNGPKAAVVKEEAHSLSVSTQLKDVVVRVVHAGGRIEMYENAIPASNLIRRYPGMCIARPDVFKHPHEAVLSADDVLLPGNKYFVVGSKTVEKLRRRQARKERINGESNEAAAVSDDDHSEGDVCTSGDFAVNKDEWSVLRKQMKENKFVPPIQRPRMWKEPDWEPSLTSIKEISP